MMKQICSFLILFNSYNVFASVPEDMTAQLLEDVNRLLEQKVLRSETGYVLDTSTTSIELTEAPVTEVISGYSTEIALGTLHAAWRASGGVVSFQ